MKRSGVAVLLAVACVSAAAPLRGQEVIDTAKLSATPASLFRTSDLIYAGLFFGSLAAIRPAEGFDEALSPDGPPTELPGTIFAASNFAGNDAVYVGVNLRFR